MKRVAIVGAGISGASVARALADRGVSSTVIEAHTAAGGLAREVRWKSNLVSEFGPHIFRSSNPSVWAFVLRFGPFTEFRHQVATMIGGQIMPFPPLEGLASGKKSHLPEAFASVGDYLVATVGPEMFATYYEHYTAKRWGVSAFELAPDMIPLIPVFRTNRGFFSETRVGFPESGFSRLLENMLDHPLIAVQLRTEAQEGHFADYDTVVWTGRADMLASVAGGRLPFRSVKQQFEAPGAWSPEGIAVVNYPGKDVPHLRRTNYGLLLPWKAQVIGTEVCDAIGPPAYPVRTHSAVTLAETIRLELARQCPKFVLHGRLGRFEYSSMDMAIERSLLLADKIVQRDR